MTRRFKELVAEYGTIAVVIYLVIFGSTWGGFALAISSGLDVDGVAAGTGTALAAYLATKVSQPLRIGATAVLTPIVARVLHRFRGQSLAAAQDAPAEEKPAESAEKPSEESVPENS